MKKWPELFTPTKVMKLHSQKRIKNGSVVCFYTCTKASTLLLKHCLLLQIKQETHVLICRLILNGRSSTQWHRCVSLWMQIWVNAGEPAGLLTWWSSFWAPKISDWPAFLLDLIHNHLFIRKQMYRQTNVASMRRTYASFTDHSSLLLPDLQLLLLVRKRR